MVIKVVREKLSEAVPEIIGGLVVTVVLALLARPAIDVLHIVFFGLIGTAWLYCVYVFRKRRPPLVPGAKETWKYTTRWRRLAIAGIVVIPVLVVGGVGYRHYHQSRSQDDNLILILIADFNDQSNVSFDAAGRIKLALEEAVSKHGFSNVRLASMHKTFRQDEVEEVRKEGESRNAAIVIWGHYDDFGLFPRFTVVHEERLTVLPEGPQSVLFYLADPPSDFTLYVNRDLPVQMTYFTQFTIGQIFYLKGSLSEALGLFEDAIESARATDNEEIQTSLAAIHFFRGMVHKASYQGYRQAVEHFSEALKLDPDTWAYRAYVNRGWAYYRMGEKARAMDDIDSAVALHPTNPWAYTSRAALYVAKGDFGQAFRDLEKAIQLDQDHAGAYVMRGIAYAKLGNLKKAVQDFTVAIELEPTEADYYVVRANFHKESGNRNQAVQDYNKAIAVDPDFVVAYLHRGNFYRDSGNLDQAIIDYTQVVNLNPYLPEAYLNRGKAHLILKNVSQAIADFEQYLILAPDAPDREAVADQIEELQFLSPLSPLPHP